jgi:hypothetical protein
MKVLKKNKFSSVRKNCRTNEVAQVVELLPSKCEGLSSNVSATKKKQKKNSYYTVPRENSYPRFHSDAIFSSFLPVFFFHFFYFLVVLGIDQSLYH